MSIVPGIRAGILTGLKTDPRSIWAGGAMSEITDGQSLIDAMGFDNLPAHLWKGNEAGPTTTDLQGSANLTDAGAPGRGTTNPGFDQDVVSMSSSSTDALAAASAAVCDNVAESMAFLWVGEMFADNSLSLAGKRDPTAPNYGWELRSGGTGIAFIHSTSAGVIARPMTASTIGSPLVALGFVDYANSISGIYSNFGNATGGVFAATTATNAATFAIGRQRLNAESADWAISAFWNGSAAEGFTAANISNLTSFLGLS